MGSCGSSVDDGMETQEESNYDPNKIRPHHTKEGDGKNATFHFKVLLLGAGGSGKSTLGKQLQKIHGGGISDEERHSYKGVIYEQIVTNMQSLVERFRLFTEHNDAFKGKSLSDASESHADWIMDQPTTADELEITPRFCTAIRTLWKDEMIQEMFHEHRAQICVDDTAEYFFDNIEYITRADYLPNDEDILHSRKKTTGIVEQTIVLDDRHVYKVVDVGGQRSERRKWRNVFDSVSLVIFVVSLSAFDEVLFEDENINVMNESLELFDNIINSNFFAEKTMKAVFLNKSDVFRRKLEAGVPLSTCFGDLYDNYRSEHPEGDSYETGIAFLKKQFEDLVHEDEINEKIHVYVTNAMEEKNISQSFDAVLQELAKLIR